MIPVMSDGSCDAWTSLLLCHYALVAAFERFLSIRIASFRFRQGTVSTLTV
jgi:hypothetical protein